MMVSGQFFKLLHRCYPSFQTKFFFFLNITTRTNITTIVQLLSTLCKFDQDQGNSFMIWNGGLPKSVPVHDIAIQTRENEIVLGTHGRSLYVSKLTDVQGLKKDPDWLKKKPKEKPATTARPNEDDDEMEREKE